MRLQLLMTGNELMTGITLDSNSAWIARRFGECGISIAGKTTIGDELPLLVAEITRLTHTADVLLINGGLGPTVDDLTAQALAQAAGLPLAEQPDARTHIEQWCTKRGVTPNAANLKQALLPQGVQLLPNSSGSAVGFMLELHGCLVLCTPGVPSEMQAMVEQAIVPLLLQRFPALEPVMITRLVLFGIGESTIQQRIDEKFPQWPAELALGFRAGLPTLELKLTSQHRAHAALHHEWEHRLAVEFADNIIGCNDDTLASVLVQLLTEQKRTITLAESCTGGLLAAQLTEVPGASAVFEAGFVTYADHIKHSVLDVSEADLQQHGAVSEPVVLQMAQGALQRSGADAVIAVSGVAGPEGGTAEKPVGTVWIAWGNKNQINARQLHLPFGRLSFQKMVAATAFDLIRRELLGITSEPRYLMHYGTKQQHYTKSTI